MLTINLASLPIEISFKGITIIQEVGHKCKKTNYDRYMLEFDFEMSSEMVN